MLPKVLPYIPFLGPPHKGTGRRDRRRSLYFYTLMIDMHLWALLNHAGTRTTILGTGNIGPCKMIPTTRSDWTLLPCYI